MAQWQIFNAKGVPQDETFDDGLTAYEGEPHFSTDVVEAYVKKLGKGYTFSYMGTPNWAPPPLSAAEVAALADLALVEIESPLALRQYARHVAIRAELEPLFAVADEETKAKLDRILAARLAAA